MVTGMFRRFAYRLWTTAVACALVGLVTVASWGNIIVQNAIAMPNRAADIEMSRAQSELDSRVGEGTSNQIEGKVQQDVGTVKRSLGKATGQVEGAADQLQGKVKRDIGRAQRAADNAGDNLEDSTKGLVESVKGFFGQ